MGAHKLGLSGVVVAAMGALLLAQANQQPKAGLDMAQAANAFLASLSEEQRGQVVFEYDSPERLNWHFIPRERNGLPLKDLSEQSLQAARQFMQSGLSESGYDQTVKVMSLEEVLFLLEGGEREQRRQRRDPQNYYISVFGKPSDTGTWGWRLEGHHLSLNYSIQDGEVVSSTPEFFGANPGRIVAPPEREVRVLGPEEDLARQILKIAQGDQQQALWLDKEAPDDIRGGGAPQPDTTEPAGLPASKMTDDQKKLLQALLSEYLRNMPPAVEKQRRAAINEAGIDKIHFAWWGSSEPYERHAYRVQGPTFLIEYNNTQNDANHIHSVWRDLRGDFNVPLKK